jgi:hypothetical protein
MIFVVLSAFVIMSEACVVLSGIVILSVARDLLFRAMKG